MQAKPRAFVDKGFVFVSTNYRLLPNVTIKEMAAEVGGTGGGRPEMAQAGGKDPARLDGALEKVFGLVERTLQRYNHGG